MPTQNVRVVPSLQFKDGSIYSGQVLNTLPHGYGTITINQPTNPPSNTTQSFVHRGYFADGKSAGPGEFIAPNGDTFLGTWNANHKRHGKGLFVRASDQLQLIEEYDDGVLVGKRVKRRQPAASACHWIPSINDLGTLQFATSDDQQASVGPCARTGHSMSLNEDSSLLIVFGGETFDQASGICHSLNDLHLLDLSTMSWLEPEMGGTVPPPMHSHTAHLVDGNLLVIIGGQLTGIEVNSSVYVLNLGTGEWFVPVTKSLPLVNHCSAYARSRQSIIVLVQGSCFELSLSSWKWQEHTLDMRGLKRSPRSFIGATLTHWRGQLVVIGGQSLASGVQADEGKKYERCIADVRLFDPETMKMTTIDVPSTKSTSSTHYGYTGFVEGSADTPRAYHSSTLVDDRYLYVIGGWTTTNPSMNVVDETWLNDVQVLDLEECRWLPSPTSGAISFITPRCSHAVQQIGTQIWMFGGKNAAFQASKQWRILQLPHQADVSQVSGRAVPTNETAAFPVQQ